MSVSHRSCSRLIRVYRKWIKFGAILTILSLGTWSRSPDILKSERGLIATSGVHQGSVKFGLVHQTLAAFAPLIVLLGFIQTFSCRMSALGLTLPSSSEVWLCKACTVRVDGIDGEERIPLHVVEQGWALEVVRGVFLSPYLRHLRLSRYDSSNSNFLKTTIENVMDVVSTALSSDWLWY